MKITFKEHCIYFIAKLLGKLSFESAHRLGKVIGKILYKIPNELKTVCDINLKKCFPNNSKSQHQTLLKKTLIETGKSITETPIFWFRDLPYIRSHIISIQGEDLLTEEFNKNNGVIVIIPHFGSWEMLSSVISYKYPTTTLYRPLRLQGLEQKIIQARQKVGNKMVPTTQTGVKAICAALKSGEIAAILPDQDPRDAGGIFVPFYNIPTLTTTLVGKLAAKTKAPVFALMSKRVANGFEIIWKKFNSDIYNPDIETSTSMLNKEIQACIDQDISQYQWSYRRFKQRPNGEDKFY